ncbi:MAG: (d)CMP kinase [Oscillospiraceae bacterium]|jgi:cytidylate kinase|nr:(d)CMP kinase [Oscillospiraceae bacterium]
MQIQIAIDGPVGAGKSTIAKECAGRLGIVYMDTGALYRAIGVWCKENGTDAYDEDAVAAVLPKIALEIKLISGVQRIIINSGDITDRIRTPDASMLASKVSSYGAVRTFLLDLQRDFAAKNSVIMDGRDIGTVILPNADVKIFLAADPRERAKRRYDELIAKGSDVNFDDVLADLEKRDRDDSSRTHAPLKQADDAILLDTTGYTFDESVERIMEIIKTRF